MALFYYVLRDLSAARRAGFNPAPTALHPGSERLAPPDSALQQVAAEQAKLDLVGCAGVFRVILEAVALEVLHGICCVRARIELLHLLGQWVAVDGQSAGAQPVF